MQTLVGVVRNEFQVDEDEIVLFRHTRKDADIVLKHCDELHEWTECQTRGGRYDFRWTGETRTKILVVIVDHCLHGVFRVGAEDIEGSRGELSSEALTRSYEDRQKMNDSDREINDEPGFRVDLERLPFSKPEGTPVSGWRGKEIRTMAQSTGKLFWEIEI